MKKREDQLLSGNTNIDDNLTEELGKLKRCLKQGLLSEDEYNSQESALIKMVKEREEAFLKMLELISAK